MTDIDNAVTPEAPDVATEPITDSAFGGDSLPLIEDEYGNLTTLGEDTPDPATENESPPVETIKIGDKEWAAEQAAELLSKGEDYTKKTMALADERKAWEQDATAYRNITAALNDPAQRHQVLAEINRQFGYSPSQSAAPTQSAQPTVGMPEDWDEWVPNEQKLWLENERTKQELAEVKNVLTQVRDHFQTTTQRERQTLEARTTAESLTKEYGRTVTPDEVLEASLETQIGNLEAAWVYKNRNALAAAPGKVAPVGKKPNTPSTRGNTFDPSDMEADEILMRMQRGEIVATK